MSSRRKVTSTRPPVYLAPLRDDEVEVAERINRLRRVITLHSYLYYRLHESIVSDHQFDRWSVELVELQRAHPEVSLKVSYMLDYFKDWDGSSGYDIDFDPTMHYRALSVLRYHEQITSGRSTG